MIAPPPVSPDDDILDMEEDEHQDIEFKEDESEETRGPKLLQDPGAPSAAEVERHCVTHMPYRVGAQCVWKDVPATRCTRG